MSLRPKKTRFTPVYQQIEQYLDQLYHYQKCEVESIKIYQLVYDLCTSIPKPYDERLYKYLIKYFKNYSNQIKQKLINANSEMISIYSEEWNKFHCLTKYVDSLFAYLNKSIVAPRLASDEDDELKLHHHLDMNDQQDSWNQMNQDNDDFGEGREIPLGPILGYDRMSILKMSHLIWKGETILSIQNNEQDQLMRTIFRMIEEYRNLKLINLQPIWELNQSLILMENCNTEELELDDLELYRNQFELPFMTVTHQFYRREAALFISEGDMHHFMIKALERIEFEEVLIKKICHESSFKKVIHPVDAELIIQYKDQLNLAFNQFLTNHEFEQCTLTYQLFNRIPNGIDSILKLFEDYVVKIGLEAIHQFEHGSSKDPRIYVELLLNTHIQFMSITNHTFLNDPQFIAAVDKAFRRIINAPRDPKGVAYGQPPEMLAKYADMMLKKGIKPLTSQSTSIVDPNQSGMINPTEINDTDPELKLSNMIVLFKYIDDKDMFQKFYSRLLAKRLIHGLSVSEDQESLMVSKLKTECGPEYTTVLQRMITDLAINRDLNQLFKNYLSSIEINQPTISTNFMILTTGAWPINNSTSQLVNQRGEFRVPEDLNSSISLFQTYYHSHHTGRKLNWMWHLCKGDLTLNYLPKKYELNCTLYQLSVLYCFNDSDTLTLEQIQTKLQLPLVDILNNLKTLIDNKFLNAIDSPLDSNISLNQPFQLNLNYNNKRFKLKLIQFNSNEIQMEDKETVKKVEEDRKLYLQSVIVRIMKSRKTLTHNQLIQEVFQLTQSQFKPTVPFIKQIIESLIDKQYMERSETNRDSYSYLA